MWFAPNDSLVDCQLQLGRITELELKPPQGSNSEDVWDWQPGHTDSDVLVTLGTHTLDMALSGPEYSPAGGEKVQLPFSCIQRLADLERLPGPARLLVACAASSTSSSSSGGETPHSAGSSGKPDPCSGDSAATRAWTSPQAAPRVEICDLFRCACL